MCRYIKCFIAMVPLFLTVQYGSSQIKEVSIPQSVLVQPMYGSATNNIVPSIQSSPIRLGATSEDILTQQAASMSAEKAVAQKRMEVARLLDEIQADHPKRIDRTGYKKDSIANACAIAGFFPALQHLRDMLEGRAKLSVADAYFSIESAYGNPYLTRQQYEAIITQSANFIKVWMKENGLDIHGNYDVQYAIQKFMSEQLAITKSTLQRDGQTKRVITTHLPFHYDFDDYQCEKDYRNSFLTKCLATGYGQCSSMPAVYLVLAEALGVKAYLTIAPQHSFIKYPDNSGNIINYEPTSNWEISDNWYKDNMFISAEAIASGIYLDTLNSRQIVANCVFDLALEYMRIDRSLNENFIVECLNTGIPYFPKNNNLESLFIYSMHVKTELRETMRRYGITSIDEINNIPHAKVLYRNYLANEGYIAKIGYQDMPAGMYEALLKQHEFKGKLQESRHVNGKEKRTLFMTTNR